MAQAPWTNADGLLVKFPTYYKDSGNYVNRFRSVNTEGGRKLAVADVDFTKIATGTVTYTSDLNNDGTNDGFSEGDFYLPANAHVLSVYFVSTETGVGGTSFTVGTYDKTAGAISATGLVTATEGVVANQTIGKIIYGAGALTATTAGTAGVGSADAYPAISVTGTYTAGKGRLYIEYVDPVVDA